MSAYIEKKVLSTDGLHELAGRVYLPDGKPKGYFHVVHGMTEHIDRYDRFMQEMAAQGYICFGYDHLGHGRTVHTTDELGFIAHKDGWKHLCRDVGAFGEAVRQAYGAELPYVLMGHSMGSFIVRVAVTEFNVRPDKLIVMGTGGPNSIAGVGLRVIRLIKACKGERYVSDMVQRLAFGAYNDRFKDENDGRAWLTADREVRRRYAADPLCNYCFTVSAMADLVTLNKRANTRAWFQSVNTDMPILLISGREDPVGDYGQGVTTVYDRLKAHGAKVCLRLYDGARHEIINDICREQVVRDIEQFVVEA